MNASRVEKIWKPVVAFCIWSAPCQAMTGKELLRWCLSDNRTEHSSCELYITGFVHGVLAHGAISDRLCIPSNITGEEATVIFVRKLREIADASNKRRRPAPEAKELFSGPSSVSVAAVLSMQFKCH